MKNEKWLDDITGADLQKNFEYYLQNIDNQEIMDQLKWENPRLYDIVHRIDYILSFSNKQPIGKCPECGAEIIVDKDACEEYCRECGLVTRNSYPYVASQKYDLPYGIRL